ncbi:hypothetical protein [Fluviicola taffensis]|uniref:Lipocalin-like domain-containing protein n=1 Tax=Fluviicola taffensis (strain DSM 16823 / NCIMB 13979 / RW262) TaxID=755732 RepID=F2IFY2_FLUTR|nr:hypothetical protein [Fluviicola taffensis]AEA43603.1 hypothetical protein Fluta_1611 [Fluviicola taffensis DSM 16823]
MKIQLFYLLLLFQLLVLSCSNSNINQRLVKKWVLTKVGEFGPEKNKVLGINHVYFDLKENETFSGRWYDKNNMTEFIDLKGKWLTTEYEDKIRLLLFYGPNQKKSIIFDIVKIEEEEMTMRNSEMEHFFRAK